MAVTKHWRLLAASVAGILAAVGSVALGQSAHALEEGQVHCYGINACQGTGDCGGKGHSCAGQNACEGQAWIGLDEELCLRIKDGRLTEEPEPGGELEG
jgi:uncharacterized membrane protein